MCSLVCTLCKGDGALFHEDSEVHKYYLCPLCGLIWMDPIGYLSRDEEHAHYTTHENSPDDPQYRNFLNQIWEPLKPLLTNDAHGLDYGSGPGPTLHIMAQEDGFACDHYDPFFFPKKSVLNNHYTFITTTETAEHFHHPEKEFEKLSQLLQPGGFLAIMTIRVTELIKFKNWHYRLDPTHVSFYQDKTFEWIASHYNFTTPTFPNDRVAIVQKQ